MSTNARRRRRAPSSSPAVAVRNRSKPLLERRAGTAEEPGRPAFGARVIVAGCSRNFAIVGTSVRDRT